ncbi:response regulator [Pseudoalteromonas sp.]|uniref:tetratricopeptide repeat-containing hybrid sensor histidine kinase/response regulator n=1 Tax=Pseudoalteromonas sp. TaxID=53249 RepID=UPI0035614761
MDRRVKKGIQFLLLLFGVTHSAVIYAITNSALSDKINLIQKQSDLAQQNDAYYSLKANQTLNDEQNARLLHLIAVNFANQGRLQEAISPLNQALKLSQNQAKIADINKLLGLIHFYINIPDAAIKYYNAALIYQVEQHEHVKAANLENNIALAYEKLNQYSRALEYYNQAEPRYAQFGSKQDVLDIKLNRAGLLSKLGHNYKAIALYQLLLNKHADELNEDSLTLAHSNIAVALNAIGESENAIKHLNSAKQLLSTQQDTYQLASVELNLADSYIWLSDFQQARVHIVAAADLNTQLNNPTLSFSLAYHRSRIAVALNEPDIALTQINKAIEIAKKYNYRNDLQRAYAQALIVYGANNLIEKAYALREQQLLIINEINEQTMKELLAKEQSKEDRIHLEDRVSKLEKEKQIQQLAIEKSKQQRIFFLVAGLLIILLIVAAQRRAHERKAKKQLELIVAQRTAELQKTSEDLRHASLVKSKFLANMSHEIRTPLTAIIGHSEAMSNSHYDMRNFNKDLNIINNNGKHLLDLINDILDISRIEENKLELDISTFNLNCLIDDISAMFATLAEKKHIQFQIINSLDDDFAINADQFRLKQILLNLCSNAVKFTDKGSVTLSIRETFTGVRFNVIDTGIGMEEKQLEEIFDSFTQGDSSISRRFGGSGLGLCLSEQLANLMSGSISVTSEINKGSEFTLHLNVDKSKLVKPSNQLQHDDKTIFEGNVLIAEDHDDNRELIKRLLTHLGLTVVAVANGKEAVEACITQRFDLVLLDIQMPVLDGIGALKQLKRSGYGQPIVAITANTMQHEISSYLELGFADHIKKPLEQDNFISTLKKYVSYDSKQRSHKAVNFATKIDNSDLSANFSAGLAEEKASLKALYLEQNWQELQQALHKLRGAAAMFNYHSIEQAADYFEKALKYNDKEAYPEAFEGIIFALSTHN